MTINFSFLFLTILRALANIFKHFKFQICGVFDTVQYDHGDLNYFSSA